MKQTEKRLEARCQKFNEDHPIGTEVIYHPVIGEPAGRPAKTRSAAYVLSGHTAVVFITEQAGCVALDAIEVVETGRKSA